MMGLYSTQMQYAQDRATQKQGKIYMDIPEIDSKVVELLNPSP